MNQENKIKELLKSQGIIPNMSKHDDNFKNEIEMIKAKHKNTNFIKSSQEKTESNERQPNDIETGVSVIYDNDKRS